VTLNRDAFRDWFHATVTIEPRTGHDGFKPTYGAAVSYEARIELQSKFTRDLMGQEVTARGRVFLATSTIPGAEDLLTLPSELEPTTPPIVNISPKYDEGGTVDHVVVAFGFGSG
jgi:hypothetical protein